MAAYCVVQRIGGGARYTRLNMYPAMQLSCFRQSVIRHEY